MTQDPRNRISDLYHAALERAPEERDAFLKEASAGNDLLRQEIESLLRYESASARFLETPAATGVPADVGREYDSTQMVGRVFGPYTIVAPLGAGGMGEVYRAHDSKLGRDVAIKLLPPHFTNDSERRARFAREARLLATLSHPHIGAIYGLEESDGLTALVLELELQVEAGPGAGISAPDWSPDGRYLLYSHNDDLWLRPMTGDAKPSKFRPNDFSESAGVFSPDGQWVAYRSDATGRHEIYVSPFPSGTTEHKVSRDGGVAPRWKGDGSELYFLAPDGSLMVASITSTKPFSTTTPKWLFETDLMLTNHNPYVVAKDGQHFLMPVPVDPRNRFQITIAVNWTSKLPK